MSNSDLEQFEKLCCDYGHKGQNTFKIEFDRIKSLKSKLELQLEKWDALNESLGSEGWVSLENIIEKNKQLKEKLGKVRHIAEIRYDEELFKILEPIAPELQAKLDAKKKLFSENTS